MRAVQKTIETARLRLRPRTLDDLEPIVAMDSDPEVRRYLGGPLDPVAHRAEVLGNIVDGTMADYPRWAIERKDRPGFLGQCGIRACHLPGTTELTWRLVRAAWRQGIASEAAAAMLAHVRAEHGAGPVVAFIHPDNAGSQGVARKLGLRPAGDTQLHGTRQLVYRSA
jgi:RimJ/RimL family protein N-acetyltransferase